MRLYQELLQGFSHLLFPRLCEGCALPLMGSEAVLCLSCLQELPRTGYHLVPDNEAALRFAGRVPYRSVTALSVFTPGGLLQHLLHGLKYKGKKETGLFLGRQLGFELRQAQEWASVEGIIPVPLHPRKESLRGYNQSAMIARGVGEVWGKPVWADNLQRTRHTESQTTKSREERVANVRNAFTVKNEQLLSGRHVLLLDDVLTTGATLEAAATALLRVPGLSISIATAGIAAG
jgi:ComF family protein